MSWQDRYWLHREPDRTLRVMTPSDIPAAVALTEKVGWQHQAADWERMLYWSPEGCFVIEEPERGMVGTVTTLCYGTTLAWIGMMIVAPDHQRHGLGGQLMRSALDYLIDRDTACIMLDATTAGRPLYEKMGFQAVRKIERWEGKASTYLGARAHRMRPEDVARVLDLDTVLFGVRRAPILVRMLEEFPELAWVDYYRGRLEGYLLGRRLRDTVYLGPWMSWSAGAAERLLLIALEELQGQHVAFNIPDSNGRALTLASNHNMRRVGHCTRMVYGAAEPFGGELFAEMSIASFATG